MHAGRSPTFPLSSPFGFVHRKNNIYFLVLEQEKLSRPDIQDLMLQAHTPFPPLHL